MYSKTTRTRTTSDGRSTGEEAESVGLDADLVLALEVVDALDMVDALGESVEPPETRLDPLQVAGIYETRFNPNTKGFSCLVLTLSSHLAWTDTSQLLHVFPSFLRPQIEAWDRLVMNSGR